MIFYGYTDCGQKRDVNQDAMLMKKSDNAGIFVVADGMGGHFHGEIASNLITKRMGDWADEKLFKAAPESFDKICDDCEELIRKINTEIRTEYCLKDVCGSTLVAFIYLENSYAVFSVGDSRAYMKRGKEFLQITQDHVWQNQSEVIAEFSQKEMKRHPNYGKLTNAMGASDHIKIYMSTGRFCEGDVFTICSDGIYKCLSDSDLKWVEFGLRASKGQKYFEKVGEKIRSKVERKGSPDNYTLILLGN